MGSDAVGLNYNIVRQLLDDFEAYFGDRLGSVKMLELGSQEFRPDTFPLRHQARRYRTPKAYFESLGIEHVSIDLNGLRGSLKCDLSLPLSDTGMASRFDVATNFGTIEHIDTKGFHGQWQAFKTMHDCVKPGGMMLHTLPQHGVIRGHCLFKYTAEFPGRLAEANGYEIRVNAVALKLMLAVSYVKVSDTPFMAESDFGTKIGVIMSRRTRRVIAQQNN